MTSLILWRFVIVYRSGKSMHLGGSQSKAKLHRVSALTSLSGLRDEKTKTGRVRRQKRGKLCRFVPLANPLISKLNSAEGNFSLPFPAGVTRLIDPLDRISSTSTGSRSLREIPKRCQVSFRRLVSSSLSLGRLLWILISREISRGLASVKFRARARISRSRSREFSRARSPHPHGSGEMRHVRH